MKKFNISKNIVIIMMITLFTTTGCFEQEDPLEDIIDRTGNYYPVVANIRSLEDQGYEVNFAPGGNVNLELQYWSFDPIREIGLYDIIDEDTSLVNTFAYQPAFSRIADTDTLVMEYTVPSLAAGTGVTLYIEVVNENELFDYGTFGFTIE